MPKRARTISCVHTWGTHGGGVTCREAMPKTTEELPMKVFVATKDGQGKRANDFSWATEGELVTTAFECDGEAVDGSCGCRRALSGMESRKSTTTFKVIEKEITPTQYAKAVLESLISGGWGKDDPETRAWADQTATALQELASHFPLNVFLEKRGDRIQTREKVEVKQVA